VRPGALIDLLPLEVPAQKAKYELSRYGLRYSLEQTFTYAGLTDLVKGDKGRQQSGQLQPRPPAEMDGVRRQQSGHRGLDQRPD
jgi:hypothetical protein